MFQQYEHILTKLATEPQSWQLPLNKLIPRCNNLVITPVFNAKNNQNTHYKQSTDTQKTGQTIQKLQQLVKQVIGITLAPETNFSKQVPALYNWFNFMQHYKKWL